MIHLILISAHAVAGLLALVLACIVLRPPTSRKVLSFRLYFAALVAMFVFVLLVVFHDWAGLSQGQRITYSALTLLGAFTAFRGVQARTSLIQQPPRWREKYVDHVGFTAISLFDGFTIVAAVDLGAPLPVVLAVGALGVIVGVSVINRVKFRLRAVPDETTRSPITVGAS